MPKENEDRVLVTFSGVSPDVRPGFFCDCLRPLLGDIELEIKTISGEIERSVICPPGTTKPTRTKPSTSVQKQMQMWEAEDFCRQVVAPLPPEQQAQALQDCIQKFLKGLERTQKFTKK